MTREKSERKRKTEGEKGRGREMGRVRKGVGERKWKRKGVREG